MNTYFATQGFLATYSMKNRTKLRLIISANLYMCSYQEKRKAAKKINAGILRADDIEMPLIVMESSIRNEHVQDR